MYCVNCGVKLSDSEQSCPLCGTRVYHPDLPPREATPGYPVGQYPARHPRSLLPQAILTAAFLLPMIVVFLCDLQFHARITWSGYVIGALLLGYITLVLPMWFRHPNPVIFIPCDFAALAVYLLYIDLTVQGGWFLPFALPMTGGVCLIVTAVITLVRYVKKGYLYIFGGASIALGGQVLLGEFLLDITLDIRRFAGWSLYPLTALVLLGGLLIFLGINRNARETMERKLFL